MRSFQVGYLFFHYWILLAEWMQMYWTLFNHRLSTDFYLIYLIKAFWKAVKHVRPSINLSYDESSWKLPGFDTDLAFFHFKSDYVSWYRTMCSFVSVGDGLSYVAQPSVCTSNMHTQMYNNPLYKHTSYLPRCTHLSSQFVKHRQTHLNSIETMDTHPPKTWLEYWPLGKGPATCLHTQNSMFRGIKHMLNYITK